MSVNPIAYDDFKTYAYDNGATVRAIVVKESSEWRVVGGTTQTAEPGDVVIALSPHTFEIHSRDILGHASEVESPKKVEPEEVEEDSEPFDPSAHNANEVARYLSAVKDKDPAEYERVYMLEQRGLNRSSALK